MLEKLRRINNLFPEVFTIIIEHQNNGAKLQDIKFQEKLISSCYKVSVQMINEENKISISQYLFNKKYEPVKHYTSPINSHKE